MDANVIRAITFGVSFVVVVAYIAFVVWRMRVHRRRREAEEGKRAGSDTLSADATLRPEPKRSTPVADAAVPQQPPTRPDEMTSTPQTARPTTVLEAVQGISLPHDLVPHPDAAPRPGSLDRVALTGTMISFEDLQAGLDRSLADLGYEVTWADEQAFARNGLAELRIDVFTAPRTALIDGVPAFPFAGEGAVVVDFWIPKLD